MGHYRFADMVPSHFFNITAGGVYTDAFDLTNLFSVLETNTYDVTMDFTSPATLVANDTNLSEILQTASSDLGKANASSIPSVRIRSDPVPMVLQASSAFHSNHKRTGTAVGACSSNPQAHPTILRARGYARSLAKFSQQYVLPPLGIAAHGVSKIPSLTPSTG